MSTPRRRRRRPQPAFPGAEEFPLPETDSQAERQASQAPQQAIAPEEGLTKAQPHPDILEAEVDDVNTLPVERDLHQKVLNLDQLNDELDAPPPNGTPPTPQSPAPQPPPAQANQESPQTQQDAQPTPQSPVQQPPQAPPVPPQSPEHSPPVAEQPAYPPVDAVPENNSPHSSENSEADLIEDDFFLGESEDDPFSAGAEVEIPLPPPEPNQPQVSQPAEFDEMEDILDQIVSQPEEINQQPVSPEVTAADTQQSPAATNLDSQPNVDDSQLLDAPSEDIQNIRDAFSISADEIEMPSEIESPSQEEQESEQDTVSVEEMLRAKGVDREMLEDMMDGNPDQQVELPQLHMSARRAALAASNNLPIASPDPKEEGDEIIHMISAFSNLEYGQLGIVRFSCRSVPEFRPEAKAWLKARKAGADIDAPGKSIPQKLLSGIKYLWNFSYYHVVNSYKPGSMGEPPAAPWKKGKDLAPLPASQVDDEEKQAWKSATEKARDVAHYEVVLRVGAIGQPDDEENLEMIVEEATSGLEVFNTPHQEIIWEPGNPQDAALGMMGARVPEKPRMVLSASELSTLAHLADDTTNPHGVNMKRSYFKQLPIPSPLRIEDPLNPPKGAIPLGLMNPRSEDEVAIGMRVSELDRHMIAVGKTGSGKSEWMKWVNFAIAKSGYPLVLVDPHGAAAEDTLNSLIINCPERVNDIVFCDVSDSEFPVAMNPLDVTSREMVEPSVKSIQEMLGNPKVGFDKAGAPRATVYAVDALTALCHANLVLEDPQNKCTLLDVLTFFNDPEFRHLVIEFCQNESIRQKYDIDNGSFEQMPDKTKLEHTQTLTRVFSTLSQTESFSAVFYSPENKLDFGKLISDKKIILIRLARFSHQAELGEFVGSLILPWMLSSMDDWGRHKDEITGETHGSGCRIIVDEAPTIMGPGSSVPQLLAEARKWDLGLLMLCQFLDQFDSVVKDASLANTASKISMVQDPNKANSIAKAIDGSSGRVSAADIAQLPPYHFYGNVLLPSGGGGLTNSGPYSAACLPMMPSKLTDEQIAIRQEIKDRSRRLICNDIETIRTRSRSRVDNLKEALQTKLRDQMHGDYTPPPMFTDQEAGENYGWKG